MDFMIINWILPNFQMPPVELLKDYGSEEISINKEELEENKNKIVGLLKISM
jgi:S-DNA-T family DNA segregation ATPase FtsK/SpoIIIE